MVEIVVNGKVSETGRPSNFSIHQITQDSIKASIDNNPHKDDTANQSNVTTNGQVSPSFTQA